MYDRPLPAATEVVVLESGARVATVQLTSGRIGFVPVAWIQSA